MEETDVIAAKQESRDCCRTENGEIGMHQSTEAEEVPRAEVAGDVDGEVPTGGAVLEFLLIFAEAAPQLVN